MLANTHRYALMAIALSLLVISTAHAVATPPSLPETKIKDGNITFFYNNQAGVSIAPRSNAAANSTQGCSANTEGAIRYNSNIKKIEFCNGTEWRSAVTQTVPATMKAGIKYSGCRPADSDVSGDSLKTVYKPYGVVGSHNIHLACPKDYVFVGSDLQPPPLPSTFIDRFCCPLHLYTP